MRIQIVGLENIYRIHTFTKKLNEIAMKYNRLPRKSLNDYTPEEMMKKATRLDSLLSIA